MARRREGSFHRLAREGWLTNQHGAWAMMILPLLVGSILGGLSWRQLLLTVSWVLAFFFFNALGLWMKVGSSARRSARRRSPSPSSGRVRLTPRQKESVRRRQRKYLAPLLTYAALATLGAIGLLILDPGLWVWAPGLAILFGLSVEEMYAGRDHSFLARASAILASQLLTPIAFSLGSHPADWQRVWIATAILTVYFVGTIPYVKTLIRERENPLWIRVSFTYHVVMVVAAIVLAGTGYLSWWIAGLFTVLVIRAVGFPLLSRHLGHPLRPAVIGFTEFAVSLLVVLTLTVPTTLT